MGSKSKETASTHITEAVRGTHSFKIVGYSLHQGIGLGQFIESGVFAVGGFDWAIRFYPDGFCETSKQTLTFYLILMSKDAQVRASYGLSLLNQATGLAESYSETTAQAFTSACRIFSTPTLIARSELESASAGYIVDDSLTIKCTVTVIKKAQLSMTTGGFEIKAPPSQLSEHFGKLLGDEEEADVRFVVGGKTFPAHKIVLATRSPVFKAQLYGQMKESRARQVTLDDIRPDVFKALLHFIYTDQLPDWDQFEDDDYYDINWHLLVAADRYAMERLKLLCASNLVGCLDAETLADILALADQHNCNRLKDVCIEFMASSDEMDAVIATEGYANLKRTCPCLLVDVLEKSCRYRQA